MDSPEGAHHWEALAEGLARDHLVAVVGHTAGGENLNLKRYAPQALRPKVHVPYQLVSLGMAQSLFWAPPSWLDSVTVTPSPLPRHLLTTGIARVDVNTLVVDPFLELDRELARAQGLSVRGPGLKLSHPDGFAMLQALGLPRSGGRE